MFHRRKTTTTVKVGLVAILMATGVGCQQTPWGAGSPSAQPSAFSGSQYPVPGGDPTTSQFGQSSEFLKNMMHRQSEQSRLSELQRRELTRLTELYRAQTEQLATVDREQDRGDRLELAKKLQSQATELRQKDDELRRLESVRRRALEMDSDNRDLQKQLAQTEQQSRLYEDQLKVMKQQLSETASRLSDAIQAQQQMQQEADHQVAALQANLQRQATLQKRSGATIRANSSAQPMASAIQIAGLNVRQDGDVVRIELPSDQMFLPGTATLSPTSTQSIAQVANAISKYYPRQKVGIEAHWDNTKTEGTAWRNSHQLSAAQAYAVFEQLSSIHHLNPRQLLVVGHGPNYPVATNNSPTGQQRNRRVEIVIYPDQYD